jgi:hypothetical protein
MRSRLSVQLEMTLRITVGCDHKKDTGYHRGMTLTPQDFPSTRCIHDVECLITETAADGERPSTSLDLALGGREDAA